MKNVLVIGLGRFGRHMARKLIEEGNEVLAVECNEERADACVEIVQNIQIGDATDERFMHSLGVDNFDLCVVGIGDNFQTVLEITVLLKDLGAPYVIARANRDVHKKLLLRNGADYVVYGERELAERLAVRNRYKVSILATRKNGKIHPLPHQDHVFSPEETLMVMGDEESIRAITR